MAIAAVWAFISVLFFGPSAIFADTEPELLTEGQSALQQEKNEESIEAFGKAITADKYPPEGRHPTSTWPSNVPPRPPTGY